MQPLALSRTVPARRSRAGTLVAPLGVAAAAAAAFAYVTAVDPNQAGHYPTCPFLAVTGLWCPGCGSLRALHALGHGDLSTALGFNVLTVAAAALLVVLWGRWTWRTARGLPRRSAASPVWLWALLGLVLVFWVVRNLPVGQPLAP